MNLQRLNPSNGGVAQQSNKGEGMRSVPVLLDTPAGVPGNSFVLPPKRSTPGAFDITISGSVSATAATYAVLFDVAAWGANLLSLSQSAGVTTTGSSATYASMKSQVGYTPMFITAINYITNATHRTIKFHRDDFDGTVHTTPIVTSAAKRNTQEQTTLLTLVVNQWIDPFTAIQVPCGASESITLTFFVGARAWALT